MLLLVIVGLMAGIALASYLHGRRRRTARARRSDDAASEPDTCGAHEDFGDDFDAGGDAD